jgi:hypothetical protein
MTSATDKCSGCGRDFAPKGFVNHLRLSRDPRCALARDRLQPTYPRTISEENPGPSFATDVEMTDLDGTSNTTPIVIDIEMSDCGDNADDRRPQHVLEDTPGLAARPQNTQVSVIFDSDTDDSDDDSDQDQASHLETGPLPPSPRTTSGASTDHMSHMSEFYQT